MKRLITIFPLLIALITACGVAAPASGPTSTPPLPDEAATAPALAADLSTATPAATGGPGGSDIVPTLSPTPFAEAERGTATAYAAISGTAAAFTPAMSETATAAAVGLEPALATRTPVAGMPRVLPAPIYLRSTEPAQIYRVEPDAANYSQITFERQPVLELAVPAQAGGIFYLVGDLDGAERTLVYLGGAGRRELLYGRLSSLVVSPDGRRIFVRIDDPEPGLIVGQDKSPAGVWATTPDGMRPSVVLADEPGDGVYDPDAPAWEYSPVAVSPDGGRLALFAYDRDGPAIPGGELVILGEGEPVRAPVCCEAPVWSADGALLYVAGGGPAPDTSYGLWAVDAATGAVTPVLEATDTSIPLVTGPHSARDGQLYAFVGLAPAEGFTWDAPFHPALSRIGQAGSLTPLSPPVSAPSDVLWSEDGSGAVTAAFSVEYGRPDQLFWQPADGRPATLIPFVGGDMAWASANAPLAQGDCGRFSPISYQEGAARRPDPAIYDLQGRLRSLGFDAGAPDGLYGEQTRAAVEGFQSSRGLPVTGDVDCATWQALLAQP